MLVPVELYIKDFLSIQEISYQFKQGETILIQGINLTDEGQESNGSGKSAFQAAIDYTLTESCPRKISSNKDLVRNGCEESTLSLVLQDNTSGKYLCIQRVLHIKNPGSLDLYYGDEPWSGKIVFDRVSEGNKKLQSIIGISFTDIHNYYLPNELTYVSFFESPDASIKELIGRFSKTDTINPVFDYVDSDIKEKEKQVNKTKDELLVISTQINTYTSLIDKEESRDWLKEKQDRLDEVDKEIDTRQTALRSWKNAALKKRESIDELNKSIGSTEKLVQETREKLESLVSEDNSEFWKEANKLRTELEEEKTQLRQQKSEKDSTLQEATRVLNKINLTLSGTITCPKCSHEFLLDTDRSVDQLKADKQEYIKKINTISESINSIEKEITLCMESLNSLSVEESSVRDEENISRKEIDAVKSILNGHTKGLLDIQNSIVTYKKDLNEQELMVDKFESEIKRLEQSKVTIQEEEQDLTHLKELKASLKSSEKFLKEKNKEVLKLEEEYNELSSWTERFKGFKSYLANTQLKTITGYTNKFLKDFNTDIEVNIEGYRQLASGELREKITPIVYRNGEERPYGLFSKGERGKINYAAMLALQTLINLTSPVGGLDLLFSDEVVEGMDSMGLSYLLEALSSTNRTNLLTTHMIKTITYDKVLTFVKENNITSIQL